MAQSFASEKRTALISLLIGAVPLTALIFLIARYAVAIPALDDWEMAPLIVKARTGGLTFDDFFTQQQESRTFFPKLIFVLLASGRHWDLRVEMWLSVFLCVATAVGIHLLLRRSGLSPLARMIAFALSALLIFSPAQQELWLLASGFPSFIPALCIVCGLVAIQTRWSLLTKFFVCAALSFFASFSLAGGLFAWGLTFPISILGERPRRGKFFCLAWVAMTALGAGIYFWNYHAQADLPQFAPRAIPLSDYAKYFFAFVGSGLGRAGNPNPFAVSIAAGILLVAIYLGALGFTLARFSDREFVAKTAPWLALGFYSLGSGALAALGRVEYGVTQALESRYIAFSLYLVIAAIALVAVIVPRLQIRGGWIAIGASAAVCLFLEIACGLGSLPMMQTRSAWGRLGRAAVLFCEAIDTSRTIKATNFPRPASLRERADQLDRLGLLRPPLVRSAQLSELRRGTADGEIASGWFDGVVAIQQEQLTAWGWAMLDSKRKSADAVLLAYARGEDWTAFAISDNIIPRDDVAKTLRRPSVRLAGWSATFPRTLVPEGAQISAWAIDAADAKIYRLKDSGAVLNPTH